MALKKSNKDPRFTNCVNVQEKIDVVEREMKEVCAEILRLEERRSQLRNEVASLRLYPFKPGDIVMCLVASGRHREEKKCVIEVEDGLVYVRPFKNGTEELSGRHFSVLPVSGSNYTSVFKKV